MPYQGYQAPPMMYGAAPQFATFDASSKRNEDSLPAMPSWDTAHTRRVEDDSQDMEMKHLEHQASGGQTLHNNANAYAPVANDAISPVHSPYHEQQDPYMNAARYASEPYLNQNQSLHSHDNPSYNRGPLSPAPTYSSGPAPTYHTTQPQRPTINTNNQSFTSDRYATPSQPQQQWSPVASTRYEPTEYPAFGNYSNQNTTSTGGQRPPSFQSFAPARQSYQAPAGQARPPSFLQVGRKPVGGSVREL
jgi:hypothetical protein